jgi:hypothetical protein
MGRVYVRPWPLRLLLVQMAAIYFGSGWGKLVNPAWRDGSGLYYILANMHWASWSYAHLPTPLSLIQLLSVLIPTWELSFFLLVLMPWTRSLALWMGFLFHVGLLVTMRLGVFPLYMMCLYLPFVPWERFVCRPRGG